MVYAGQRKIRKEEKVHVSSCNGLPNAGRNLHFRISREDEQAWREQNRMIIVLTAVDFSFRRMRRALSEVPRLLTASKRSFKPFDLLSKRMFHYLTIDNENGFLSTFS
jgi:hypothetical protein